MNQLKKDNIFVGISVLSSTATTFRLTRIAKLKYTPKEGWLFTSEEANSLEPQAADDPFETPLSNRGTITLQTDFYLYDHLGNTRVTYQAVLKGDCEEKISYSVSYAADYYPYGKILREYKPEQDKGERYLTTQHERDAESGLDYRGARFYDSDLGRFLSLDPMATKYLAWSAYNYVLCKPVLFIDPDGRDVKPSNAFLNSSYNAVYNNLVKNSSAYRDMLKPYADNGGKMNYILAYEDYIDKGKSEVGNAVAKTRNVPGLTSESNTKAPSGGSLSTYFILLNITAIFKDVEHTLNDIGRASTLLHEAIHANLDAVEPRLLSDGITLGGVANSNQHETDAETIQGGVLKGLQEFDKANKLNMSPKDLELVSWNGLHNTSAFREHFNIKDANDTKAIEKIQAKIDAIIYNSPKDDKGRNNVKN